MHYYKNIIEKRKALSVAGSKGTVPSYLMPPSSAFAKVGFQIYEALDLLCEGPIGGLVSKEGLVLETNRTTKGFSSKKNVRGSNVCGIDKGIYFDDIPLRESTNEPTVAKYDCIFRDGSEYQAAPEILSNPQKITKIGTMIRGAWINSNGAKDGSGSLDTRSQGRDFVGWQNYIPREVLEKPYYYENYDKEIDKLTISLQIDALYDTYDYAGKSETKSGKSRLGTNKAEQVTLEVTVGKIDKNGKEVSAGSASFTTRAGKGVTLGNANGRIAITGVITSPYALSLEGITLPILSSSDINNFVRIKKIEAETTSSILRRDIGVMSITEINSETYLYPHSAYVGTSIDSKYFSSIPSRTFRAKGKKILIPSNYFPVNGCLADRRFSKDKSSAGRVIYGDLLFEECVCNENSNYVVFLIDTSGSMAGTSLSTAKISINNSLDDLIDQGFSADRIAIVRYNSGSSIVSPYSDDLATMKANVNALTAGGGTNMTSGLTLIQNSLMISAATTAIIALSDGDVGGAASTAAPIKAAGTLIITVGIGITEGSANGISLAAVATPGNDFYTSAAIPPDFLSGIVGTIASDLNGIVLSNNQNWDGTFKFGYSDNPAWIYYDLLINTRYGLGGYLRDVNIVDKWSLYEIGRYCDAVGDDGKFIGLDDGYGGLEPRFSCNILIKDQASAFEGIQDIARAFRAMSYFSNSIVKIKVDKPYFRASTSQQNKQLKDLEFPPHLIFNNLNVKEGVFAYADVDRNTRLSAVEVSFLDKTKNYTSATEYVEDTEAIKQVGLNYKQLTAIGATSRSQAYRLAKYLLFESIYTTETVSFSAGLEALMIEPGDIIRVDDEMRNFTKNFGTVIGTSGETLYYNPDGLSLYGQGPSAIIVEPAFNSDQFENLTGGVLNIFTPIGKSGVSEFNEALPGSINQDLFNQLNNPQVVSLLMKPGGSGSTYEYTDSGVLIYINQLADGLNNPSQWFSDKNAGTVFGSSYSIDVSGRSPKYFRVLTIKEDTEMGFNVTASIHHTGKFQYVEDNITFDPDTDTFQPNLIISNIQRPNTPINVITGEFQQTSTAALNLPLSITSAENNPGDSYVIYIEEPNTNVVVAEFPRNFASPTTNIILGGYAQIDQVGSYLINVFSKNDQSNGKSNLPYTISFVTEPDIFNFNTSTDSYLEYGNISLRTDYLNVWNDSINRGSGQVSFVENQPTTNATFDFLYQDIFGNIGNEIAQIVSNQYINLKDYQGQIVQSGFKILTNEPSLIITNQDLDTAFGYNGIGVHPASSGYEIECFVQNTEEPNFVSGSGSFFVEFPKFITTGVEFRGENLVYKPTGSDLLYMNDIELLDDYIQLKCYFSGDLNDIDGLAKENIKNIRIYTGNNASFQPDITNSTNLIKDLSFNVNREEQSVILTVDSVDIQDRQGENLYYKVAPFDYLTYGNISNVVSGSMYSGFDNVIVTINSDVTIDRSDASDLKFYNNGTTDIFAASPISISFTNNIPLDFSADFRVRTNTQNITINTINGAALTGSNDYPVTNNTITIPGGNNLLEFNVSNLLDANGNRESFLIS